MNRRRLRRVARTLRRPARVWLCNTRRAPLAVSQWQQRTHQWIHDDEHRQTIRASLTSLEGPAVTRAYDTLTRIEETAKLRTRRLAAGVIAIFGVVLGYVSVTSWWAWLLAPVLVLPIVGSRARIDGDDEYVDRQTDPYSDAPLPTNELVVQALLSIGVGQITKANATAVKAGTGDGFRVLPPGVIRDDGDNGYRFEVELPPGVTVEMVTKRLGSFASALRRPSECVFVERGAHDGHLIGRILDRRMADLEQEPWPLLASGRTDMFNKFPIGTDFRGRPVELCLMYVLMIIGAQPRMGKSFLMRLIAVAAALDPHCQIDIYNLKGGSDFNSLKPVCHRFRNGCEKPEDAEYVMNGLREIWADMNRRYDVIEKLDETECPEGKTTPTLSARRSLKLHPRLVMFDETQKVYENPDFGKEAEALVIDISKRGPAAGIFIVQATQRVDAQSIPKGISSNATARYCLRVDSHIETDLILGTGAYKNGYRPADFDFDRDKGVGYLRLGGKPFPVRTYYLDALQAKTIIVGRALPARKSAGTLTGFAANDEVQPEPEDMSTMLDHLAAVWPMGEDGKPKARLWWGDAGKLLADRYPQYIGITDEAVRAGTGLKGELSKRVIYDDFNEKQYPNRRGPDHEDLMRVLAARNLELEEVPA